MMPKPNPNKRKEHQNRSEFNTSEKILLETKPSFWLYSDNFILKIIVLFILVFMFSPIMAVVYVLHEDLVENFHIAVDNVMFYTELLLFLLILVVLIKLILDVLDWNYTNYVFTDSHVVIQRGFIHKEKIIMAYHKIQDIEINQSILERIMGVGDIIIYGANEMSETILDDIPSPKKAEEIILNCMNAVGFAQQNTYNNYQQNPYNQQNYQQQPNYNPQNQYNHQNYQQQPNPNQQNQYNPQNQYNQQNYQQHGPNQQYNQQFNYNPQNNYNPQPNYQPINEKYSQEDFTDEECIQPDHTQENVSYYDEGYEGEVITPERQEENWQQNNQYQSSQELDKEQIFKKHNQMFKRHKK